MLIKTTAQKKILQLKKRVRIVRGGTSASKTFSIIPFLITYAVTTPNSEISIVAESIPNLKRGALRDFLKIMNLVGMYNDSSFNKSSLIYTFQNGSYIEFFSADSESKLRGARRDVLFINECNNITWDAYYQMAIRTRKFIYLDYNPVNEFWVDKELINDVDSSLVVLTYKDNEALDASIVRELEKAKEKAKTSKYWANWYKVYGLGEIGTLQGTVFENWSIVKAIPKDAELIAYSMDWGYSNDPTALVSCYKYGNEYYFDELIYQTQLTNSDIIERLVKLGVSEYSDIIADSAEPKSIEDLRRRGFSVSPAKKGPDSIRASISLLQEIHFKVTENSLNLIKELRNYCWDTDKDGNKLQMPIDANNHCFIGETLITTNKGQVRIDRIKVGDLVLTSSGYKKVLKVFNNGLKRVTNYLIDNDIFNVNLVSTKEHKIKTLTGWKQISNLKSGQMVYIYSSDMNIKIAKLRHLEIGESYRANVYDLFIEDEHEYFANGLLVHNCIDCLRYLALNKLSSLSDWMDFS